VALWREEISKSAGMKGFNPSTDEIPDAVLDSAFSKAAVTAKSRRWIRDSTAEYREKQIRKQLKQVSPSEDSMKTLLAQPDVRKLVLSYYKEGTSHGIMKTRVDEFVTLLVQHKARGGDINVYNAFSKTKGKRVGWAIARGYLYKVSDLEAVGNQSREKATAADKQAAQSFFKNSQNLDDILTGVITGCGQKCKGKEDDIRARIHSVLISKEGRDKAIRRDWGIDVDAQGKATVRNPRKATDGIGVEVRTWLTARSQ
jgi:hypothetical protein